MPVLQEASPDGVALDVSNVCPVEPFDEAWETHVSAEFAGASVVGLAGAEVGAEGAGAICVEEIAGDDHGFVGTRRDNIEDFVS